MIQATTRRTFTGNVYEPTDAQTDAQTGAPPAARKSGLRRHLARRWDLYGILTLMASCAAYGVSALAHLA